MKYVSRSVCESRGALGGVIKEVELLSSLEHPFLVNLWFSFQGKYTHTRTFGIYTHTCVCVYVNGSAATCVYWEPPQLIGNQNANELCMCISFDARPFTWHTPSFFFTFSFLLLSRSGTSLILRILSVCLRSPFADEEDLFMVCDLLTGGDLRYHLQNRVSVFSLFFVLHIIVIILLLLQ